MVPIKEQIRVLDVERQEIQDRIQQRAIMHRKGIKQSPKEIQQMYKDALRYIEIENKQWALLDLRDSGEHQQPPL